MVPARIVFTVGCSPSHREPTRLIKSKSHIFSNPCACVCLRYLKHSHLIFQITTIFTTSSAIHKSKAITHVFFGSNNKHFIHEMSDLISKFHDFDLVLLFATAILIPLRFFSRSWVLCPYWWMLIFGEVRLTRTVHEDSRNTSLRLYTNMASGWCMLAFVVAVHATLAAICTADQTYQKQICSFYGKLA